MVDERLRAAELLRVLKYFYSFTELSAMLGIPGQVLWRYASLRVVPERGTARKIIEAVESRILPRLYESLPSGPKALAPPMNPGVLELAALDCASWCRGLGRLDAIAVVTGVWGAALGFAAARLLRLRLCPLATAPHPFPGCRGVVAEAWSCGPLSGVLLAPRGCIGHGDRVVAVAFMVWCREEAEAVAGLLESLGCSVAGVYAYTGPEGCCSRVLRPWRGLQGP